MKHKTQNSHHSQPKIKIVSGADYNNAEGWWYLHNMIKMQVDTLHPNKYDPQWLNWMINLDKMPNGFTTGVEDEHGELQCLLIAEWIYNMWINQRDCTVVGILKTKHCPSKYIDLMMSQLEWWAKEHDCKQISIFTWDARKGYLAWAKRKGFNLQAYVVQKEIQ